MPLPGHGEHPDGGDDEHPTEHGEDVGEEHVPGVHQEGAAYDEAKAQLEIVSDGSAGKAEEEAPYQGRCEERTHCKADEVDTRQVDHGRGERGYQKPEAVSGCFDMGCAGMRFT